MKKALMLITFLLFLSPSIFAQDPGIQDSIIIETVYIDSGATSASIRIFIATDDSVAYFFMPWTWQTIDQRISASDIRYEPLFNDWSIRDTIMVSERRIRMMGFPDGNQYLFTHGQRMHCMTIEFGIDPLAAPQDVMINGYIDPAMGGTLFGLYDGVTAIFPVVIPGHIYYRQTTGAENENPKPGQFYLSQNYPNPFNASTEIIFDLPSAQNVNLSIYNLLGQQVAVLVDDFKQPGRYSVNWNGTDNPSGVYFYRLETSGNVQTRKMIMMK